jgi:hypothetical protein
MNVYATVAANAANHNHLRVLLIDPLKRQQPKNKTSLTLLLVAGLRSISLRAGACPVEMCANAENPTAAVYLAA